MRSWLAGVLLGSATFTALAATRLEDLVVKPTPAGSQAEIAVTVNRGQFDKQGCDIVVSPGDGSPPVRVAFGISDERTKVVRHAYQKDGSYTVKATAGSGCTGTRSVGVIVGAGAVATAETKPAPEKPQQAGCPAGWYLVPESAQGARYSCRPNLPAQALKCEGGTSYFSEGGVIGCR